MCKLWKGHIMHVSVVNYKEATRHCLHFGSDATDDTRLVVGKARLSELSLLSFIVGCGQHMHLNVLWFSVLCYNIFTSKTKSCKGWL